MTTLVTDVATAEAVLRARRATGRRRDGRRRARPRSSAIDLGTTEVKAGLVTLDGRLLGLARAGYRTETDAATGRAEQDPEAWWGALATGGPAARRAGRRPTSSRSPSTATARRSSRSTPRAARPGRRSSGRTRGPTAEQAELAAATGSRGLVARRAARRALGRAPRARRRGRGRAGTSRRGTSSALRLTGRAATSLLAGQPFPSARACSTRPGSRRAKVPPPVRAGEVLGELTAEAAAQLGIGPAIPVVAGIVDAWASFHGAGMTAKGDAIDVGGAAGGFGVYWDQPLRVPGLVLDDRAAARPVSASAARWRRPAGRSTGSGPTIVGGVDSTEVLLEEAAATQPGADGVAVPAVPRRRALADLGPDGARRVRRADARPPARPPRPGRSSRRRRSRSATSPSRSSPPGVERRARCASAAARPGARRWNQIKADVTGFPVAVPAVLETAVVGAAILGAAGIGAYPDVPAAIRGMTRVARRLEPTPELPRPVRRAPTTPTSGSTRRSRRSSRGWRA